MARYNKQAVIRDQQMADYIRTQSNLYSNHSDAHLKNALRFAKGCFGSEARAREELIKKEMRKRK